MKGRTVRYGVCGIGLALLTLCGAVAVAWPRSPGIVAATLPIDATLSAVAADERGGHLFVLGLSNGAGPVRVYTIDARSGALLHAAPIGASGSQEGVMALDTSDEHLFAGLSGDGAHGPSLSVIDARSGAVLKRIALKSDPVRIAVDERTRRVFVAEMGYQVNDQAGGTAQGSDVMVLDARSGAVLRVIPIAGSAAAVAVDEAAGRVVVTSQQGVTPITSAGSSWSILDARSGRVLRTAPLLQPPRTEQPQLAVDSATHRAFIGEGDDVAVLDTRSGARLGTVAAGGLPIAMAVDEGAQRVFVLAAATNFGLFGFDSGGTLLVLDAASGRMVRSLPIAGNPDDLAVDAAHGRVLVATMGATNARGALAQPAGVIALDARSGAVLRTIHLNALVSALAVDGRSGHVAVLAARPPRAASASPWSWLPGWLPFLSRAAALSPGHSHSLMLLDLSR